MRHLRKATLALPVVLIVLGLALPIVVGGGSGRPPARQGDSRYAGRTADEWRALAMSSLERGRLDRALKYLKTAERTEPGSQYGSELASIRGARRRALAISENRKRMLDGETAGIEIGSDGAVTSAYRTTVALPGESQWVLAERLVAARERVLPSEIDDGRSVYSVWDEMTDLNGVREIEVGEVVRLPLSGPELVGLSRAHEDDLERVRLANAALDSARIGRARALRGEIRTALALESRAVDELDERIRAARAARLASTARRILAQAFEMSRTSRHGELVKSLRLAAQKLDMARQLGASVSDEEAARAARLLSDAERFRLDEGGAIITTKPVGVSYAEFARSTVEWFMNRSLERSGKQFPYSDEKSLDEIGWAEYMLEATEVSESHGMDFAELLVDTGERSIVLPNPAKYFEP